MQVNGKIILLVAVGVGVYLLQKNRGGRDEAANDTPEVAAPATPATASAAPTTAVHVRDRIGKPVQLDLADGASVIVVGTWDPGSRALINALNDAALQQYLHGTAFTFLIERDEWSHVKEGLRAVHRGLRSEEEIDAQIAARRSAAGNSGLYDEGVVDHILRAGGSVYYFDRADGIRPLSMPAFHTSGNNFTTTPADWLARHGVPADVARSVLQKP